MSSTRCIIALICGLNANCSCPICLAPRDELSHLDKHWPLRNKEAMKDRVLVVADLSLLQQIKELQDISIRPIKVCCDIYVEA